MLEEVSANYSTWTKMIPLEFDSRGTDYIEGIDDLGDQIYFGVR